MSQISQKILNYLREEFDDSSLEFILPPSKLDGGYETTIYQFKLNSDQTSFSQHLILRQFRKEHSPNHSIKEKIVQNSLFDQGFPVPYVHFACTSKKHLGTPFTIMDYVEGEILPFVFGPDTNVVLGNMHSELHSVDPSALKKHLTSEGLETQADHLDVKINQFQKARNRLPWLDNIINWLIDHKPSKPEYESICHGDFHPGNILAKDKAVSAILDWSCFYIGDPLMDVALTLVVFNTATKNLIPTFDADIESQKYLEAYQNKKSVDNNRLKYYQVFGCVNAVIAGTKGVTVWTQPNIQRDLVETIKKYSGVLIQIPG